MEYLNVNFGKNVFYYIWSYIIFVSFSDIFYSKEGNEQREGRSEGKKQIANK